MNATQKLISMAMKARGLTRATDLARLANWSDARVSNYRRGISQADERAAEVLAEIAGVPMDYAVLLIEADRVKSERVRRVLLTAAERLAA